MKVTKKAVGLVGLVSTIMALGLFSACSSTQQKRPVAVSSASFPSVTPSASPSPLTPLPVNQKIDSTKGGNIVAAIPPGMNATLQIWKPSSTAPDSNGTVGSAPLQRQQPHQSQSVYTGPVPPPPAPSYPVAGFSSGAQSIEAAELRQQLKTAQAEKKAAEEKLATLVASNNETAKKIGAEAAAQAQRTQEFLELRTRQEALASGAITKKELEKLGDLYRQALSNVQSEKPGFSAFAHLKEKKIPAEVLALEEVLVLTWKRPALASEKVLTGPEFAALPLEMQQKILSKDSGAAGTFPSDGSVMNAEEQALLRTSWEAHVQKVLNALKATPPSWAPKEPSFFQKAGAFLLQFLPFSNLISH